MATAGRDDRGMMAQLRRRPLMRRFLASGRASTVVEFALVGGPFFLILFAILETALFLWAGQVLDTATAASARLILTGQAQNRGMAKEDFKKDVCDRIEALIDCNNLLLDVYAYDSWSDVDMSSPVDKDKNVTASGQTFQTGSPSSIVVVRAVYQYPILVRSFGLDLADLANGKRLLVSTVAFVNEPYAQTSSLP